MRPGVIAAILIALSFTLFELYTVKRSGYRMEPTYILDKYAAALHGAELCGEPTAAQRNRFTEIYTGVRRRAAKSIGKDHPDYGAQQIEAAVAAMERKAEISTATLVQANGCKQKSVRRLLVSFEMRTR